MVVDTQFNPPADAAANAVAIRAVSLPDAAQEHALRCDMAAVFRIAARLGWNEQIGNHNSVMMPRQHKDEAPTFLINPRGLLFQEITASSLIVCDLEGNVLRGDGELRKVAFHIHARIHVANPAAVCVVHVHPQYLTALSMLEDPMLALAHHNNLLLNDRVAIDNYGSAPADSHAEGDRLAAALGDKSILLMGGHGVTVIGRSVADAFDECFIAERTAMYQVTAMSTGGRLRRLPEHHRRGFGGPWGEKVDARLHLDAWRRVLDREEPDYAR
jgi:ribulose-5-phosphate 4-epimerase/fuculose-1-phosphate aldolase